MIRKVGLSVILATFSLALLAAPAAAQGNTAPLNIQVFDPLNAVNGTGNLKADLHVGMGWKQDAAPTNYPAVGFSPHSGLWTLLQTGQPKVLDWGIMGRVASMVGNDKNVWVFVPQVSQWAAESLTSVDGYDIGGSVAIAWCDNEEAFAYSTFLSMKAVQPLTGGDFASSVNDALFTTAALLFNSSDAYGYSSLTNSWGHQALSGPPEGNSPGQNCGLIWTADTKYGFSSAYSGFVGSPVGNKPITGVAGSKVAITYSTEQADLFDGLNGQWIAGPTYNQSYPPNVRVGDESALVWADSGAWAFDLYSGTWYDTGIVPGSQQTVLGDIHDNTMLLWNNNEAWGYHRATPYVNGEYLALDGTPVMAHVSAGGAVLVNTNNAYGLGHDCTWVAQPLDPNKTYQSDMGFGLAVVWTDDEAYVFNTHMNAWQQIVVANPVGLEAECAARHVVVWNATKAYAYDMATDTVYEQAINGNAIAAAGAMWVCAVFSDSLTCYAFSSETASWSEQVVDAWPSLISMRGHEVIVATPTMGYGYSAKLGTWSSQAMTNAFKTYMGITLGMIYTPTELWGHSAYTGTWTNRPL